MEKTKKMTKRDYFTAILNTYPLTDAEKDFVKHEIELLEKKNSTERKPTAKQNENAELKAKILATMEPNRLYTATEVQKEYGIESNQRASALLRQMIADGTIVRTEDKRKAYFSLAV